MSRRLVAGLLTFLMLMSMTAAIVDLSVGTVSADSSGDYTYTTINGGTGVEITGYTGSAVAVVIPSTSAFGRVEIAFTMRSHSSPFG